MGQVNVQGQKEQVRIHIHRLPFGCFCLRNHVNYSTKAISLSHCIIKQILSSLKHKLHVQQA